MWYLTRGYGFLYGFEFRFIYFSLATLGTGSYCSEDEWRMICMYTDFEVHKPTVKLQPCSEHL